MYLCFHVHPSMFRFIYKNNNRLVKISHMYSFSLFFFFFSVIIFFVTFLIDMLLLLLLLMLFLVIPHPFFFCSATWISSLFSHRCIDCFSSKHNQTISNDLLSYFYQELSSLFLSDFPHFRSHPFVYFQLSILIFSFYEYVTS